jgi:hypothetical protein
MPLIKITVGTRNTRRSTTLIQCVTACIHRSVRMITGWKDRLCRGSPCAWNGLEETVCDAEWKRSGESFKKEVMRDERIC